MKRIALLVSALALAACTTKDRYQSSVEVQGICAPTQDCTFSNKCDMVAMGNARLDPGVTTHHILIVQLENQLADNSSADKFKLNTNDAHVDKVVVKYGGVLSGSYSQDVNVHIPTATTGLVWFELIPSSVALPAAFPARPNFLTATALVSFRGYLDDGSRFETGEYPVTIEIASGGVPTCAGACPQAGQWPGTCPAT